MSQPLHPALDLGAVWHPEHWPEDQWPIDIARMRELGINCVRLFETAWHRLEPREWDFEFDWAVRLLDQLRDAGIHAIITTPSAAPPAWMLAKYPEILRVLPDGRRASTGLPRPYSVVSSRYRDFCSRMVDQMVHAFRGHDAIIGWQIDHRMGGADYGNESRRAFHNWLHDRFGQIESLNAAWGLELASQAYEYVEQVPLPAIEGIGRGPLGHDARYHPSLMIAFQRFINDQWSSFIQTQCEMIRAGFDLPISISMTPNPGMNFFRLNHLIERVAMDLSREGGLIAADPLHTLMHFDRMRAEKPGIPYWLTGAALEGRAASEVAWLSLLLGAQTWLIDPWRQPWSGPGIGGRGVVSASGRWTGEKENLSALLDPLKAQSEFLQSYPPLEARIALVISNESAWAFSIMPPEPDFDYQSIWREEFYLPVAQSHYWRDVIDQTADFCPYGVLIMPLLPILFRPTRDRLMQWVREGGCLLLGPLTGHRGEEFTAWTDDEFGGLEELIGATCAASFVAEAREALSIVWGTDPKPPADGPRPPTVSSVLTAAAKPHALAPLPEDLPRSAPRGTCHAFAPDTAHVLARFHCGDSRLDAAILMNKVGQGTVITLGARVDRESYVDLVHTLCELAKIEPLATGSGQVAVIPRMNNDTSIAAYGLVNLSDEPHTITLPKGGVDLLSQLHCGLEIDMKGREVKLVDVGAIAPPPAVDPEDAADRAAGDSHDSTTRPDDAPPSDESTIPSSDAPVNPLEAEHT